MAELATIARPYAEALFRVAEGGDIAAWSTLVSELAQVAALPEVQSVATSPKVSHHAFALPPRRQKPSAASQNVASRYCRPPSSYIDGDPLVAPPSGNAWS